MDSNMKIIRLNDVSRQIHFMMLFIKHDRNNKKK